MHEQQSNGDFSLEERRALEAWTAAEPPDDFAARVLANEARARGATLRRTAVLALAAGAIAAGSAALTVWIASPARGPLQGSISSIARETLRLGDRAIVVSEPNTDLRWEISAHQDAEVEQRRGNAFYRVEPGGRFVVHTGAGDVRVTGTCFRVEVEEMKSKSAGLVGATAGAAIAAAVVVTVYEGEVVTASPKGELAVAAGEAVRIDPERGPERLAVGAGDPGRGRRAASDALGSGGAQEAPTQPLTAAQALDAYAASRKEADRLRAENETLKKQLEEARGGAKERVKTFDLGQDELERMAEKCELRWDMQPIGQKPVTMNKDDAQKLGISDEERALADRVLAKDRDRIVSAIRALYLEVTGDNAAGSLAPMSMYEEIADKAPPGEIQRVFQKLSRERAGLEPPPADLGVGSAWERLFRLMAGSGDTLESGLAAELGAGVAHRYRELHDGFGSRTRSGYNCPNGEGAPAR
jgi:FecR-like protein